MDSNSDLMLEVQANSPYNDGWTQQFYREQLEKNKTMSKQVDFEKYEKFVDAVTSDASTDFVALSDRLVELDENCLLYTSPSPRDLSTSRMPSSA